MLIEKYDHENKTLEAVVESKKGEMRLIIGKRGCVLKYSREGGSPIAMTWLMARGEMNDLHELVNLAWSLGLIGKGRKVL